MPEVGASILSKQPYHQAIERKMSAENSPGVHFVDLRADANLMRAPDYFITLFNIVDRKFVIQRPPSFPMIVLAPCPRDKPWKAVARIPNIVNEKFVAAESGETQIRGIIGERFATDLLNPSNTGIDMWADISDDAALWIDKGTDDMTKRGLFWAGGRQPGREVLCDNCGAVEDTEDRILEGHDRRAYCRKCDQVYSPRPNDADLAKCKGRLERFYRQLLTQAEEYARNQQFREIGYEHHLSADYFGLNSSWHQTIQAPQLCEYCGDAIKAGIAYHMSSSGLMCIRNWKSAVKAGVKQRSDVPIEERWWKDEPVAVTANP